jgi:hypothetical protein
LAGLLLNISRKLAEPWLNPAEPLPAFLELCGIKKPNILAYLSIVSIAG